METLRERLRQRFAAPDSARSAQTKRARSRGVAAAPRFGARGFVHLAVAAIAVLAIMPSFGGPAAAAGSATITINSLLDDGSSPLPFARFQITDSNGTIYGPLESAPPDGKVTFTVDPVDDSTTFTIEEETPPACGIAADPVEIGPLADGEETSVDILTSFLDDCDLGSISIYAYTCPDGTDGSSTDYADFRDGCIDTVDGNTFEISEKDGQQSWNVVTGAYGISGRAPLVGLNPGDYLVAIKSIDPPDYSDTVAFCLTYNGIPGQAVDPDSIDKMDIGDDGVELTLDGERIACDFFMLPEGSGSADNGDQVEEPTEVADDGDLVSEGDVDSETATIEIHLAACPAGYDAGNYFEDCHGDGIEGRTVSIDGPGGFFDSMDTVLPNTPGPGIARFENLAAGDYQVAEDIPGDTVTYIVYCSKADSEDVVDFTYDDSTSESIWLELTDSLDVVCDWYIIPDEQNEPDPGKITVTKYTCPTGYDSDAYEDLSADCTDKTDGVTFTLSPHSGGSDKEAVTGDSGTGRVRFTNLDDDGYDLSEDVPGEFSTPVVWCNVAGGSWYQKTLNDFGATTFDVDPGDDIRCSWFNIPEDLKGDGSLKIHKSVCPAGLTSGYFANCYDDTLADVTFILDGPGDYENSKTTGDNGVVKFSELSAGTYTVTEIPPDDIHVAVYVVVCTRNGENFDFDYNDATGLRINLKIPAGADIVCDWYNVPPAKPSTAKGSITVIKSLCQGNKNNDYDWENDCENYGSGAEFELTTVSSGKVVSGSTNSNGKLAFSGLANGAYSLDETNGDWCHAEADHVDASGNVLVQNGGNTNVYVYNCSKSVNVLPSTGAGPTSGPGGVGGRMALWGAASLFGLLMVRRVRRPRPVYATVRRAA